MTEDEKQEVRGVIGNEGFDYTYRYYTHFRTIKDAEFHRLRKAYIKAADALEQYVGEDDD